MKTDQDLIFEAYNKTLNEGSHLYGDNIKESWQENNPIPAQFLDSEETKKNIIDSNIHLDTAEEVYKVAVVDFWNYLKEKGIL